MPEKRVIPGGYVCRQRLDDVAMYHAEILHDLEAIINISASQEEIYRVIANIINKLHKSNAAINEIKQIY